MQGRDPFDDPFFTRPMGFGGFGMFGGPGGDRGGGGLDPFQMMDQMMSNMLSGFPHHGMGLLGGPRIGDDVTRGRGLLAHDRYGGDHGAHGRHHAHHGQPSVEEIHAHGHQHEHLPRSGSAPIVEEPDDEPRGAHARPANGRHPGMGHTIQVTGDGRGAGSQPRVYSYSSSTTIRQGPNGVYEAQHREEDSSGRQRMGVARGVGDRAKAVIKERAGGQERTYNKLHGIREEEVSEFDHDWEARAAQMPRVSYDHRAPYDGRSNNNRIGYQGSRGAK